MEDALPADDTLEIRLELPTAFARKDGEGFTERLVFGPAEHSFGGGVPRLHVCIEVERQERERRGLEQRVQRSVGELELRFDGFLRRDVEHHALEQQRAVAR